MTSNRLLIIACSKAKVRANELLPAFKLYDGPRWRIFRKLMSELAFRPRVVVLSAKYGIIKPTTYLPYYDKRWTGNNWREDMWWIEPQYRERLKPLITKDTDIFVAAGAAYRAVLDACGILNDVVRAEAVYHAPIVPMGVGLQLLREWLLKGYPNHGEQGQTRQT